ncbi:cytochrome P450-like protein [Lentinula aciculospora]|uniref:Cytochrome P450-like protein n=1 Tax=Lentinula aciculospora TaxID=153920 RepID=A0A9W9A6I7_9AGAR|nr:cytochrome P450-like protein [Lentinula aciculospora]
MDATFGIREEEAKLLLPLSRAVSKSVDTGATPGLYYVDQIPLLRYVPEWFPGAGFKRQAREWSDVRNKLTDSAFQMTKEQVAMGTATISLVSVALKQMNHDEDLKMQEDFIKAASTAAYMGGSDTTVIALLTGAFLLAMLMNPEVQVKAHHELDQVLGSGNLPSFNDEASLPYITAIIQETLRHNPVLPLAFPHELIQDDNTNGIFYQKAP